MVNSFFLLGMCYLSLLGLLLNRKFGSLSIFAVLSPNILSFVIKPIYIGLFGWPVNFLYADLFFEEHALRGLFQEVVSLFVIVLTVYGANVLLPKKVVLPDQREALDGPFVVATTLTLSIIIFVIAKFGTSILAENRSNSLTLTASWLRLSFPFVLFGQIIIIAQIMHYFNAKRRVFFALGVSALLLGFYLLNQRGVLFICIALIVANIYASGKLSSVKAALIFGIFAFLALVGKLLNTGSLDLISFSNILDGPDSAGIQVWSILFQYVAQYGYDYGVSVMNGIFGVVPHFDRISLGLLTTTDVLNVFYSPDVYISQGFGFNGTLSQGLFIGFGGLSTFIFLPFSILFVALMRWSEAHFRAQNYRNSLFIGFLGAIFIGGGFQTLHWLLPIAGILVLGYFPTSLSRFRNF